MNILQIISIAVSMVCGVITTVLAWIILNKRTQTEVSFTGVPVDKQDFDAAIADLRRGLRETASLLAASEAQTNAKFSHEIIAVHNRVNEVLSAVSKLGGVVEQLTLRIGELRGDIKLHNGQRRAMPVNLKPQILRILRNMSGEPLSLPAIVDSVRLSHPVLPEADIVAELQSLEAGGYAAGTKSYLIGTTLWVLTAKGNLAVSQL